MQPKHWYALLLLLLVPVFLSAQTGKIRGKVVDETTKEPLIGANIVVEGTTMGAATDVNGEYIVINVAAGEYTLKASYVGYKAITVTGVRVNIGLTAEQNFNLPGEGVAVPTVTISAERPLINKSATSAVRIINQVDIEKLPARGLNAFIALQPGIVTQGGNFFARGSRADDMSYSLEGAPINDPINGGRLISLIQESLEEIQVMVGGYTAEFGGSNGAIVRSQLRTGGEQWRFTLMGETDRLAGTGSKFLGRYNNNTSETVITGGGPVSDNIRLFLSGRYAYDGPGDNTWQDPFSFGKVITLAQVEPNHKGTPLSDTVTMAGWGGGRGVGYSRDFQGAGTVKFDFKTTQIQLGGTVRFNQNKANVGWQYANADPNLTQEGTVFDGIGTLKLTQFFNENTLLDATLSYQRATYENYDPTFKDNFWLYGDSAANAARGVAMRGDNYFYGWYQPVFDASRSNPGQGIPTFAPPGVGFRNLYGYNKGLREGLGVRANFSTQMTKEVEFKVGGEYQTYSYSRYTPPNIFGWAQYQKQFAYRDAAGKIIRYADPTNPSDSLGQQLRYYIRNLSPDNFGYDLFGNKIDNDVVLNDSHGAVTESNAPLQPKFIGAFIQSKIELKDIVINAGLRWDYFNTDALDLIQPHSLVFNDSLNIVANANFTKQRPLDYLQPRFGFSFPVTDKTVFHATFGRFVEMLRLNDMVHTAEAMTFFLRGGYFFTYAYAFGLAPQQSTQYEVGFAQQIGDVGSVDVTASVKNVTDQPQYILYYPDPGAANGSYPNYVNQDFTAYKGLEFKFTLRRTSRVQMNINYTLSDAKTTGSSQTQNIGVWGASPVQGPFLPRYVQPSTFNQTHTGVVQFDYRFGKNDGGPVLEQLGANLLFRFGSGFNWTRLYSPQGTFGDIRNRYPMEEVGASTTPWNFRLDGRIDKTVDLGPVAANIYVYVTNILNSKIPYGVKVRNGDVFNDGFLQTADGKAQQAVLGNGGAAWAQMYDYFNNSVFTGNIDAPRNIRVGMQLQF